MEAGVYVNSPDAERSRGTGTNTCQSGGSKVITVVAVSFGLLCVIQAALNVSLRLGGGGDTASSPANCSGMTVDQDIGNLISELEQLKREWEETLGSGARPEEGQLLQENMQLRQEKQLLLRHKNQLRREKERLARQNSLLQLKSQTLADENIRLEAMNSRLSQELQKCGDRTAVETLTQPPAIYIDDYSGY